MQTPIGATWGAMTVKVSKAFMRDFAQIANIYEWNDATVEEVKEQTRGSPELMRYWQELAAAHRAGYKQTEGNNWMRLGQWQQLRAGRQSLVRDS